MNNTLRYLADSLTGAGLLILALAVLAVPTQMSYADDPGSNSNCVQTCTQLSNGMNSYDSSDPERYCNYIACMNTCMAASKRWCYFTHPDCDGWCAIGTCGYTYFNGVSGSYFCRCRIVF